VTPPRPEGRGFSGLPGEGSVALFTQLCFRHDQFLEEPGLLASRDRLRPWGRASACACPCCAPLAQRQGSLLLVVRC
jgi:hypothetical protein